MAFEVGGLVSPTAEVPVIDGEVVLAIRALADCGVGTKTIARVIGIARNTVKRYLRQEVEPGAQMRLAARRLTDEWRSTARTLYEGTAGGNAVVVHRLVAARGLQVSVRTIERAVPTCGRRVASRSWRRCASKRRRGSSCRSISGSSAWPSPACPCVCSCWLRS